MSQERTRHSRERNDAESHVTSEQDRAPAPSRHHGSSRHVTSSHAAMSTSGQRHGSSTRESGGSAARRRVGSERRELIGLGALTKPTQELRHDDVRTRTRVHELAPYRPWDGDSPNDRREEIESADSSEVKRGRRIGDDDHASVVRPRSILPSVDRSSCRSLDSYRTMGTPWTRASSSS
jgi:hypothetical protein